jgi:hypothetical protein
MLPLGVNQSPIKSNPAGNGLENVIGSLTELKFDRVVGMHTIDLADPNVINWIVSYLLVVGTRARG